MNVSVILTSSCHCIADCRKVLSFCLISGLPSCGVFVKEGLSLLLDVCLHWPKEVRMVAMADRRFVYELS